MSRSLLLPHLDEVVERGCQSPNCPHDHGSVIFLTPLGHPAFRCKMDLFQSPVNNFIEPSGGDRMAMTS